MKTTSDLEQEFEGAHVDAMDLLERISDIVDNIPSDDETLSHNHIHTLNSLNAQLWEIVRKFEGDE